MDPDGPVDSEVRGRPAHVTRCLSRGRKRTRARDTLFAVLESLTATQIAKGDRLGYCAGRAWCYVVLAHDVHAYALWGVPEMQDVEALLDLWDASYASMPSHAVLADMRGLELVAPRAFASFLAYFRSHRPALHGIVTNACILLNESLAGSVAASHVRGGSVWRHPHGEQDTRDRGFGRGG